jgi:hypothetical protein
VFAGSASATTITFNLGDNPAGAGPFGYHYSSNFSVTSGGYTLAFSNPGGAPHQNNLTFPDPTGVLVNPWAPNNELAFERDSTGLTIGNWWYSTREGITQWYPGYTNSFTMMLTGPTNLVLTGYTISWVEVEAVSFTESARPGSFELTQGGSPVSTGNALGSVGTFGIGGGPLFWQRGTSMEFLAPDVDSPTILITLESLTFQVTAIPGSGLAAIGSLGLAGIARRRR